MRLPAGGRAQSISRECKPFLPRDLGPTPGPTNKDLSTDSSRSEITAELISDEFTSKWAEYTCEHAEAWREENEDWKSNRIEQAMLQPRKLINRSTFELWIAIRIRLSESSERGPATAPLGRAHASMPCASYAPRVCSVALFGKYACTPTTGRENFSRPVGAHQTSRTSHN